MESGAVPAFTASSSTSPLERRRLIFPLPSLLAELEDRRCRSSPVSASDPSCRCPAASWRFSSAKPQETVRQPAGRGENDAFRRSPARSATKAHPAADGKESHNPSDTGTESARRRDRPLLPNRRLRRHRRNPNQAAVRVEISIQVKTRIKRHPRRPDQNRNLRRRFR